jgi:glycosyltransferase involved in cell wall biosynthesis
MYDTISVLLPTFNRASSLKETLTNLAALDRTNLQVEFVVIDNNSTDSTKRVIDSFKKRLPLRPLFQRTPGKNAALNLALRKGGLGDVTVFTDDDILPQRDWLVQIALACRRQPAYDLFGGKTYVVWPQESVPAWATSRRIIGWGFACNDDLGDGEGLYPEGRYPVGFNYWVRTRAIGTQRFDESLGPVPAGRTLGDETQFQMALERAGHKILYCSRAIVGHRIQPELVTVEGIYRRALSTGRSTPHVSGLSRQQLFNKLPLCWRLLRYVSLLRHGAVYLLGLFHPKHDKGIEARILALREMAADREMLRVSRLKGWEPPPQRTVARTPEKVT